MLLVDELMIFVADYYHPEPVPGQAQLPTPENLKGVTLDQSRKRFPIPSTFQGLSDETNILANAPSFLNSSNNVIDMELK